MEEINAHEFDQVTATGKVVVDFYGTGCINCRMLEPVLTDLSQEFPDVKFVKINVDQAPHLVKRYGIVSLPTVLFFKHGQDLPPFVGLKPKNFFKRALEDYLS